MSKGKKRIPELRFPEFMNEGEWEEKELDKLTTKISDGIHTTPVYEDGGEYYFINGNNLIDGSICIDEKTKRVSIEEYLKHKKDLNQSSILLSINGTIGNIAVFKNEKVILGKSACYININEKKVDKNFIIYFIQTDGIKSYFNSKLTGSTIKNLSLKSIKETIIKVPINPQEQQKIATCLSSLDAVITAYSQRLDTLKDHKKGLMQNLFPQEGEMVPKYRFPEFVNDGEWKENTLDEVASFLKGKGISKLDIVENGSLPCIRYGELYTHYNETIRTIKSYTNLGADDLVLSKVNDVIIPASGETQIDIATASCVLVKGVALGGDLNIIRTKINGVFLSYYLNNAKRKDIAQLAQGISVVHLYPNQLKTLKINYPDAKEQHKIAECLSSLDNLISTLIEKIEQLKLHKKGLMQSLFPKIQV